MDNQKVNFVEATVPVEPADINQSYGYVSTAASVESGVSFATPIDRTVVESKIVPPTSVNSYYTPARVGGQDNRGPIAQRNDATPNTPPEDVVTMPVMPTGIEIQPTIGWLVCLKGECRGMDYRLYGDYSLVGRQTKKPSRGGVKLTVGIPDSMASASGNIRIAFDRRNCAFYVEACEGASNMSYLNNKPIFAAATALKANDVISIGNTDLMFIPLCSEKFSWEEGLNSVE